MIKKHQENCNRQKKNKYKKLIVLLTINFVKGKLN